MKSEQFAGECAAPGNPKWNNCLARQKTIYHRDDDIRSEFARDYNRILHSTAYRRLKHKTQVFFATRNDHICTRIEHVNHVASVSQTIATFLGLNTELTSAIATGHDVGHAPFGHEGETVLKGIGRDVVGEAFWHEKNSLWFIDRIETLPDPQGRENNLNLTYAVRDGIVSHCGEVDEKALFPREEMIDLECIEHPGQYAPYTWEGCVVKIADKISYLGRDIEDALTLGIVCDTQLREMKKILKATINVDLELREINNTVLMHEFIVDLCKHSNPRDGIRLSDDYVHLINTIKGFNYRYIYFHPRLRHFKEYARLVIDAVFETLAGFYRGAATGAALAGCRDVYPLLATNFHHWLVKYSNCDPGEKAARKWANDVVYDIEKPGDYTKAAVDFISGMTDSFALRLFGEITDF